MLDSWQSDCPLPNFPQYAAGPRGAGQPGYCRECEAQVTQTSEPHGSAPTVWRGSGIDACGRK